MNKVRLVFMALGALALAGGALATDTAVKDFHGVRLLSAMPQGDSGASAGTASRKTLTMGPYDTDAVVFITWTGESYRQPGSGAGTLRVERTEDGVVSRSEAAIPASPDRSITAIAYAERYFLKRGETKTVALKVESLGAIDPNKVWTEARLTPIVVATPQH